VDDEMPTPLSPDDAFADQVEWLSHRYDLGYLLGGTIRPELRLSFGVRAKRLAAALALGTSVGIFSLLLTIWIGMGIPVADPLSVGTGVLSFFVARRMWKAADADASGVRLDFLEEAGRLSRTLWLVALATLLAVAATFMTVVPAGALWSLSSSELDAPVGLGLCLLVAALLKVRASK
jgi:hypothetical protein